MTAPAIPSLEGCHAVAGYVKFSILNSKFNEVLESCDEQTLKSGNFDIANFGNLSLEA